MCAVFDAPKPRPDLGRGFDVVEAASRIMLDAVAAIRNRVEITACDSQGTEVALHDHVAVAGFLRRVYMTPMQFVARGGVRRRGEKRHHRSVFISPIDPKGAPADPVCHRSGSIDPIFV